MSAVLPWRWLFRWVTVGCAAMHHGLVHKFKGLTREAAATSRYSFVCCDSRHLPGGGPVAEGGQVGGRNASEPRPDKAEAHRATDDIERPAFDLFENPP